MLIDKTIEQYANSLRRMGAFTDDDINEIKDHMRDSIDALVSEGLEENEAILVAKRRMGTPEDVSFEYAKVNRLEMIISRLGWFFSGIVFYVVMSSLSLVLSYQIIKFLVQKALPENLSIVIFLFIYLFMPAAAFWLFFASLLPKIKTLLTKIPLIVQILIVSLIISVVVMSTMLNFYGLDNIYHFLRMFKYNLLTEYIYTAKWGYGFITVVLLSVIYLLARMNMKKKQKTESVNIDIELRKGCHQSNDRSKLVRKGILTLEENLFIDNSPEKIENFEKKRSISYHDQLYWAMMGPILFIIGSAIQAIVREYSVAVMLINRLPDELTQVVSFGSSIIIPIAVPLLVFIVLNALEKLSPKWLQNRYFILISVIIVLIISAISAYAVYGISRAMIESNHIFYLSHFYAPLAAFGWYWRPIEMALYTIAVLFIIRIRKKKNLYICYQ